MAEWAVNLQNCRLHVETCRVACCGLRCQRPGDRPRKSVHRFTWVWTSTRTTSAWQRPTWDAVQRAWIRRVAHDANKLLKVPARIGSPERASRARWADRVRPSTRLERASSLCKIIAPSPSTARVPPRLLGRESTTAPIEEPEREERIGQEPRHVHHTPVPIRRFHADSNPVGSTAISKPLPTTNGS